MANPTPPKLVFAGTPALSAEILEHLQRHYPVALVLTAPDKNQGRGRKQQPSAVKTKAIELGIAVETPATLNEANLLARLQQLQPDLMIVVAYGQLIPESILTTPKRGCVNIHFSLLPQWRGAAPMNHAILAGDDYSGITLMQMDKGLDSGDILLQQPYPLSPTETTASLSATLTAQACELLPQHLAALLAGEIIATPQDHLQKSYAHKLKKSDGVIDWSQSAKVIERRIRAYTPWPGCSCFLAGKRWRIHQAEYLEQPSDQQNLASPGSIIAVNQTGIIVQTAAGVLRLTQLQADGKKTLPIRDILNANQHAWQVGNQLTHHS